jgi:hypothetical protein
MTYTRSRSCCAAQFQCLGITIRIDVRPCTSGGRIRTVDRWFPAPQVLSMDTIPVRILARAPILSLFPVLSQALPCPYAGTYELSRVSRSALPTVVYTSQSSGQRLHIRAGRCPLSMENLAEWIENLGDGSSYFASCEDLRGPWRGWYSLSAEHSRLMRINEYEYTIFIPARD